MTRWLKIAAWSWSLCAIACGAGLIVAATSGQYAAALWSAVALLAALGVILALARYGRAGVLLVRPMSCLVPGCVEPVEDHPPFCADHDWSDFATPNSPTLHRMEVYVDVKPDPDGRPAVLLQLPDGFVLLPDPSQVLDLAARLEECANEAARRQADA